MATLEARGFVKRREVKTSGSGSERVQFTLAVQQKRKDKDRKEIKETIYLQCVDFDGKDAPAEGEYVGVTGYLTLTTWEKGDKHGYNADVTVKSYEKLPQKESSGNAPAAAKDAPPPSDPFALSPDKA
jgi:single-stranded DNA-binding protein